MPGPQELLKITLCVSLCSVLFHCRDGWKSTVTEHLLISISKACMVYQKINTVFGPIFSGIHLPISIGNIGYCGFCFPLILLFNIADDDDDEMCLYWQLG